MEAILMALDPQYVLASGLQEGFIDKDSGELLSAGVVTFYSDLNRTDLKPVYEITGTPPNYSYIELPNPLTLSSIGTIQDGSGNDVVPYYKPYDDDGNVELYYITVESEGSVLQFTRMGWPNTIASGDDGITESLNLVPNGQFLIHSDIVNVEDPVINTIVPGEITEDVTILSQGGWSFERDAGSTSTDIITFERFNDYVSNPTASPRYALNLICSSPDVGDSYKDVRLKFSDVNKFASTTQQYRFAITGLNNGSGSVNVDLILIKNFGTGGSATTETDITTFSIGDSYTTAQTIFTFGINDGETIGDDNDDFIQLALRFPTDNLFDISITDIVLMEDVGTITTFPPTPDNKFKSNSISGWVDTPAYDGSDLYLPIILTPAGQTYNRAVIGDVVTESYIGTYTDSLSTTTNRVLANGVQLPVNGYSPLGIPFSRLWEKYWDSTNQVPIYGTGAGFITAYPTAGLAPNLQLVTNTAGSVTATADGVATTGFAFSTIHTGQTVANVDAYYQFSAHTVVLWSSQAAQVAAINAGTSGFTVSMYRNSSATRSIALITPTAAASIGAGTYFQFSVSPTSNYTAATLATAAALPACTYANGALGVGATLTGNVIGELSIDGVVASGRVLIKDQVTQSNNGIYTVTANSAGVAFVLTRVTDADTSAEIINSYGITISSGSTNANTTWIISSSSNPVIGTDAITFVKYPYYVWFTVNGAGADPAPIPNATGIRINLLSTFDQDTVGAMITNAINGFQQSQIIVTSAATIVGGDYFTFSTLTTNYYVWYKVQGVGTDPAPIGKIGILVSVLTADTAAQVLSKTQLALNSQYFATPVYNGQFLRGIDNGAVIDPNAATRVNRNLLLSSYSGDVIGTFEFDDLGQHIHSVTDPGHIHNITDPTHRHATGIPANLAAATGGGGGTAGGGQYTEYNFPETEYASTGISIVSATTGITIAATGIAESRPVNTYVNFAIIY